MYSFSNDVTLIFHFDSLLSIRARWLSTSTCFSSSFSSHPSSHTTESTVTSLCSNGRVVSQDSCATFLPTASLSPSRVSSCCTSHSDASAVPSVINLGDHLDTGSGINA